ncbi:hypothetical protein NFI96_007440, partial [Prochilodus magdalenae]
SVRVTKDQHKDYSFHSENIPPEILRSPELHGVIIPLGEAPQETQGAKAETGEESRAMR